LADNTLNAWIMPMMVPNSPSSGAIVTEVYETFAKLPFYADHAVDEVLIIDPADRTVRWLGRDDSGYRELTQSAVVPLGPAQLAAAIDWPPPAD
jgi:hypothetical protein